MNNSVVGIIGGSGVYKLEGIKVIEEHIVETPYGNPSDKIIEAALDGNRFYFIARHGMKHTILPHEVNYCANIYALKKLGVRYIISVSAVGSLKEEFAPTHFVLPDQFIDWTKGGRRRSFFGDGIVGHVSVANPINLQLQEYLSESCQEAEIKFTKGGSYICIEGPQFSTKAESAIYRSFGASVIGMTNVPESYLAKEADIAYATIAMVTDYDCWKEEHCTLEEIMKTMTANNGSVKKVLKVAIAKLLGNPFKFEKTVRNSILTPLNELNEIQREIVEILAK